METLPSDVFFHELTYLPFDAVTSLCQTDKQLHEYCTNTRYENSWRRLIDNTFSSVDNYQELIKKLLNKYKVYNYLVYVNLIKYLDPITQAMIYYKQGDKTKFETMFNLKQKYLAMFLLGKKDEMMKYLPNYSYLPFVDMLENKPIPQNIINNMLIEMVKEGSLKGVKIFLAKGADINVNTGRIFRYS